VVEHPAEFHVRHPLLDLLRVRLDRQEGGVVVLRPRQVQQLRGVANPVARGAQAGDYRFERLLLLAELLGPFGIVPDVGILEQPADFTEALPLGVVVKDTSATGRLERRAPSGGRRWR